MYLADTTVLSKDKYPEIFEQMEKDLRLSKNLYNAALFRIRQVFTGWDKEEQSPFLHNAPDQGFYVNYSLSALHLFSPLVKLC